MKIKFLVPLLFLVACGVESAEDVGRTPSPSSAEIEEASTARSELNGSEPPSLLVETCAASSLGGCANARVGTVCGTAPARWCLPAQELPDGSMFCRCQSHSTE